MKPKFLLFSICLIVTVLPSCGLFNNIQENHQLVSTDRDYILINNTPFNSLAIYVSRQSGDDCSSFSSVTTLTLKQNYPFHVSPGETVYIRYCAPKDVYCMGCRLVKLIGNSENESNSISLQ